MNYFLLISMICLLPIVFGCISQTTRGTRTVKDDTYQQTPAVTKEDSPEPVVQYTFLDTVNKGNELVLTDDDFDNNDKADVQKDVSSASGSTHLRVQVFASNKIDVVREQKKVLENQIKEPVVIGYEAPYYKLYAGSFIKRASAKKLLLKLKKIGYIDAWIVSTSAVSEN